VALSRDKAIKAMKNKQLGLGSTSGAAITTE